MLRPAFSRSALLALVVSVASTGCMTYAQQSDHPTFEKAAEIAAGEIAFAALISAAPDKDPNSEYSKTPYLARAGETLGGVIVLDAFAWLVMQSEHDH
jgi:hypothetical protein